MTSTSTHSFWPPSQKGSAICRESKRLFQALQICDEFECGSSVGGNGRWNLGGMPARTKAYCVTRTTGNFRSFSCVYDPISREHTPREGTSKQFSASNARFGCLKSKRGNQEVSSRRYCWCSTNKKLLPDRAASEICQSSGSAGVSD